MGIALKIVIEYIKIPRKTNDSATYCHINYLYYMAGIRNYKLLHKQFVVRSSQNTVKDCHLISLHQFF